MLVKTVPSTQTVLLCHTVINCSHIKNWLHVMHRCSAFCAMLRYYINARLSAISCSCINYPLFQLEIYEHTRSVPNVGVSSVSKVCISTPWIHWLCGNTIQYRTARLPKRSQLITKKSVCRVDWIPVAQHFRHLSLVKQYTTIQTGCSQLDTWSTWHISQLKSTHWLSPSNLTAYNKI